MRRVLLALVFLLAVAPLFAGRAAAYDFWCADDPIVSVDGRLVDIQVQMPVAHLATMRSTMLTVVIPRNTFGAVLVDDVSAFPMQTTISPTAPAWDGTGALPITIVVEVTALTRYEIRVTATQLLNFTTPLGSPTIASGTTDVPVRMKMSLGL